MSLPEAKQENFQIALYNYIEGAYVLTEKYFVGANTLDTTSLNEWVEFSWHNVIGREIRHVNGKPGQMNFVYLDALIHVKPTSIITRITRIKDTLIEVLERAVIDVLDYVGSSTTIVGGIQGQGVESDYALGLENDVNKHLITFKFQFMRRFERYTT